MSKKEIFSKNLNAILDSLQKTQIEVANAIGVSQQTFNTWSRGIAIPRMDKIQALADYFHIPMSALIEDSQNISSSLTYTADEMAKAANLYGEYIKASPEIQNMIDSLLKLSQSIPNIQTSELPMLNELKHQKSTSDIPFLKKDSDK